MRGVVRSTGTFSGGTFHSAIGAFSRARQMQEALKARRKVEPQPPGGRSSRAVAGRPQRDKVLGYWLVPLPTIDPQVVARSGAALEATARTSATRTSPAPRRCGTPRAAWSARARSASPPRSRRCGGSCSARSSRATAPTRRAGPSRGSRSTSSAEGDGRTIHTRVKGGDPGYEETAKMLAESALCLLYDDNPDVGRQRHHRRGDGRQPDGPARRGRDHVRGAVRSAWR